MLQIFANALLIATRMQPPAEPARPHRIDPQPAPQTRRRWFGLV